MAASAFIKPLATDFTGVQTCGRLLIQSYSEAELQVATILIPRSVLHMSSNWPRRCFVLLLLTRHQRDFLLYNALDWINCRHHGKARIIWCGMGGKGLVFVWCFVLWR